ncbi:MAG: hypothetical protein HY401_03080 [Elusimicrobia bacterium]|nr:hypothetical protein [Elusimicrobiota bacterium]
MPLSVAKDLRRLGIDAHFGNPLLYPPKPRTGIVVLRLPKFSVKATERRLVDFLSKVQDSEVASHLIVLEPTRIRRKKIS